MLSLFFCLSLIVLGEEDVLPVKDLGVENLGQCLGGKNVSTKATVPGEMQTAIVEWNGDWDWSGER